MPKRNSNIRTDIIGPSQTRTYNLETERGQADYVCSEGKFSPTVEEEEEEEDVSVFGVTVGVKMNFNRLAIRNFYRSHRNFSFFFHFIFFNPFLSL